MSGGGDGGTETEEDGGRGTRSTRRHGGGRHSAPSRAVGSRNARRDGALSGGVSAGSPTRMGSSVIPASVRCSSCPVRAVAALRYPHAREIHLRRVRSVRRPHLSAGVTHEQGERRGLRERRTAPAAGSRRSSILSPRSWRPPISRRSSRRSARRARRERGIIWGFGAHVIKTGLGPVLIDLMERGFVSALATNGAGDHSRLRARALGRDVRGRRRGARARPLRDGRGDRRAAQRRHQRRASRRASGSGRRSAPAAA